MTKQSPYGPIMLAALAAASHDEDDPNPVEPRSEGQRLLLNSPQSLATIASKIGVSKQAVSFWKRGKLTPNLSLRYKLQAELGIPPDAWNVACGTVTPGLDSVRAKPPSTTTEPAESRPYNPPASPVEPVPEAPERPGKGSKRKGASSPEASSPTTMAGVEALLVTIREARGQRGLLASEQVKLADAETRLLSLRHRLEKESELAEDRIVRQHPKWLRIRTRLAEVLVKCPQCARAVAAALKELDP